MKLSGYQIREALRRWGLKRDGASGLFDDSLKTFEGETKESPKKVMTDFARADMVIAKLQVAQDIYNLANIIEVQGRKITMAEAVKLIGGAGRQEKMWRTAASPKKERYSSYSEDVRKTDEIRATATMKPAELLEEAEKSAKFSAALRAAIAVANGKEIDVEVEGLEASVF